MEERRSGTRHRTWRVMRLERSESGTWIVMGRNLSATGVLLATATQPSIGEAVTIVLRTAPGAESERSVEGTIVRVERAVEDLGGAWPHRAAVQFDEAHPELERIVVEDAESWSSEYLTEMEREEP